MTNSLLIPTHAACPAGTYRSSDDSPTGVCKQCPANTRVDVVAAPMCECLTGFFRNTEGTNDACPAGQSGESVMNGCTSKQTNTYTVSQTIFCSLHPFL